MQVIDSFLPARFTDVLDPFSGYEHWNGDEITNIKHEIIDYCRGYFNWQNVETYEYWFNTNSPTQSYNYWHQDKIELQDYKLLANWSCILYPNSHSLWGGFLEIETADETRTEVERIAPRFNRCVLLDTGVFHRVSRVWEGDRHSFVINGFDEPDVSSARAEYDR